MKLSARNKPSELRFRLILAVATGRVRTGRHTWSWKSPYLLSQLVIRATISQGCRRSGRQGRTVAGGKGMSHATAVPCDRPVSSEADGAAPASPVGPVSESGSAGSRVK